MNRHARAPFASPNARTNISQQKALLWPRGDVLPVRGESAFTLVEVMIGFAVIGIMMLSLFAGLAFVFREIESARENVRATAILESKMEVVRLYNWDQLVNLPGYVPSSFVEPYSASGSTNSSFSYYGTVVVTNTPLSESYASDLRMIQVSLTWGSGSQIQSRQMTTFVSKYGLQNYVY